jgi:hypothetical protein
MADIDKEAAEALSSSIDSLSDTVSELTMRVEALVEAITAEGEGPSLPGNPDTGLLLAIKQLTIAIEDRWPQRVS